MKVCRPNLVDLAIKTWDGIEVEGEKVMRSKPKNKFVSLSAEETAKFKQKVQPVFDRFVKLLNDGGDDGKKILAEVEALQAKYSK